MKETSIQFELKVDLVKYRTRYYSEYSVSTEFIFSGLVTNKPIQLNITIVSDYSVDGVNVTIQVWNFTSSSYAVSGEGYLNYTSTQTNETRMLCMSLNPYSFARSGSVKVRVSGILETTSPYLQRINMIRLDYAYYPSRYDYVIRVVNFASSSWRIRLRSYNESNIDRLKNCTIRLHNGEISNQISIINGTYLQSIGAWLILQPNGEAYIAIIVTANSTKPKSQIYIYLEVLIPQTSIYTRLPILLEIS